jgi:hypothetical protein
VRISGALLRQSLASISSFYSFLTGDEFSIALRVPWRKMQYKSAHSNTCAESGQHWAVVCVSPAETRRQVGRASCPQESLSERTIMANLSKLSVLVVTSKLGQWPASEESLLLSVVIHL